MDQQHIFLLVLFLLLAVVIAGLFLFVFWSSRGVDPNNPGGLTRALYKRILLAAILASVAVIFLTVTLPKVPYYHFAGSEPSQVVFVYAHQFAFIMSDHSIDPNKEVPSGAITYPVGKTVEFRVTSMDVNHGFVIYDDHNQIIAQTQAMPGYVNRLRWEFDHPGTYEVRCLEYCGFGHAVMSTPLTVK